MINFHAKARFYAKKVFIFFWKFVIVGSFKHLIEGKMKQYAFLSVLLLTLTGCFGQNTDRMYASDNLRAPTYQPYNGNVSQSGTNMPQSVTQPMNINPVPTQTNMSQAQTTPAQPQQPLVQTIVIPQYTPQPTVLPYAQAPYGVQQQTVQPFNNAQQITIPAQSIVAPNTPVVQPQTATPQNVAMQTTAPVQIPQPKIQRKPVKSTAQNKPSERVFPSWASPDFSAQDNATDNAVISFRNPNRNETVQCSAVDVMCIASYQQQGYVQVSDESAVKPVPAQTKRNTSGYPDTEWEDNTIPRW